MFKLLLYGESLRFSVFIIPLSLSIISAFRVRLSPHQVSQCFLYEVSVETLKYPEKAFADRRQGLILLLGNCAGSTRSSPYKSGCRIKCYTGLQTWLIPVNEVINGREFRKLRKSLRNWEDISLFFLLEHTSSKTNNINNLKVTKKNLNLCQNTTAQNLTICIKGCCYLETENDTLFLANVNKAIPTEACIRLLLIAAVFCSYLQLLRTLANKVNKERGTSVSFLYRRITMLKLGTVAKTFYCFMILSLKKYRFLSYFRNCIILITICQMKWI